MPAQHFLVGPPLLLYLHPGFAESLHDISLLSAKLLWHVLLTFVLLDPSVYKLRQQGVEEKEDYFCR